jgi:hypothetical protein
MSFLSAYACCTGRDQKKRNETIQPPNSEEMVEIRGSYQALYEHYKRDEVQRNSVTVNQNMLDDIDNTNNNTRVSVR